MNSKPDPHDPLAQTARRGNKAPRGTKPVSSRGREAAKAKARRMLENIVPFERWVVPARVNLSALGCATAREFYDKLVAAIRRQAEDPTPTSFFMGRNGEYREGFE